MASSETGELSSIVRDLKRFTSKKILKAIEEEPEGRREVVLKHFRDAASKHVRNKEFQVWMHHNHPIELSSNKFIRQRLNYIHNNPVAAGMVEFPEDYMYSSASNYVDEGGILKIVQVSREVKTV